MNSDYWHEYECIDWEKYWDRCWDKIIVSDRTISINQSPTDDAKIRIECTRNKAYTPNEVSIYEE